MEESMFKVIVNKEDEVFYNDGKFLDKCCILIFKSDFNFSDDMVEYGKDLSIMTAKFGGDIVRGVDWVNKRQSERRNKAKKYMYLQDFPNKTMFKLYRKIHADRFKSTPEPSTNLAGELFIDSPEAMKKLINDGYDVFAFTSQKQYGKVIADYLISNAEMYGLSMSPYEIYQEWVHPTTKINSAPQYMDILAELWDNIDKVGDELLNDDKAVWTFDGKSDKEPEEYFNMARFNEINKLRK